MKPENLKTQLHKTLGLSTLWGLGVGYVISGMYCGWNLGLAEGGPFGLLIALALVTVMYLAFVLSYSELACAMPQAGGAFVYSHRVLGKNWGFLAGVAQAIEFVFAPPAIAAAIGAYFGIFFPQFNPITIALVAYLIFTALNCYGVKQSAVFELIITTLAVVELFIFAGVTGPHFQWAQFSHNALPQGLWGVLPAIPYAVWFYLGIEGLANVAEEARNPQKDLSRAFVFSMLTLVVLALLTFFCAVGVGGWESVVYVAGSAPGTTSDSPLPMALVKVVGVNHPLYHLLITIGLGGLVASFHGLILCAGRTTMEFGRVGYASPALGRTHATRKTPIAALIVNMVIGFIALLTGHTGEIITIAVFGALTLYAIAMITLLVWRKNHAADIDPAKFKTPGFPAVPLLALALSVFCLIAMAYFNLKLALIYLGIVACAFVWFHLGVPDTVKNKDFHTGESA